MMMRRALALAPAIFLAACNTNFHSPMSVNSAPLQALYYDHTLPISSYSRHVIVTPGGMMHVTDTNGPGHPGTISASLQLNRGEIQTLVDSFASFDSFSATYPATANGSSYSITYGAKSVKYSRGIDSKDAAPLEKIASTIEYMADRVIKNQINPRP